MRVGIKNGSNTYPSARFIDATEIIFGYYKGYASMNIFIGKEVAQLVIFRDLKIMREFEQIVELGHTVMFNEWFIGTTALAEQKVNYVLYCKDVSSSVYDKIVETSLENMGFKKILKEVD